MHITTTPSEQDFPMQINIHFCLEKELYAEIKTLNQMLVVNGSDIDFTKKHIPHLTVLLGNVPSLQNYTEILKGISKIASQIKKQKIVIYNPYRVTPKKNFVFIDVAPKNKIKMIKYAFFDEIKKYMHFSYYGRPKVSPHITLGYIENLSDEIENTITNIRIKHTSSVISKIGISPASDKGTCLKELCIIDLVSS